MTYDVGMLTNVYVSYLTMSEFWQKRQKTERVSALLNKYLAKQRHMFDYVDNAKE